MRLTKATINNPFQTYCSVEKVKKHQLTNKLGQLEDIEEELGVDLITYVKATTQPILYIKNVPFDNEIKMVFMEAITINDNKSKDYLIWFSCDKGKRYLFLLKDYGKTWALTKEELEK